MAAPRTSGWPRARLLVPAAVAVGALILLRQRAALDAGAEAMRMLAAVAVGLAGCALVSLGGRSVRHPALFVLLGGVVLHLLLLEEFRGSTRWLRLPGVGLFPMSEWVACLALVGASALGSTALRIGVALGALACLTWMNAKTHALLTLAVLLSAGPKGAAPPAARAVVASTLWTLGLALALMYTTAGDRVRQFVLLEGPGGYTASKLAAMRDDVGLLPRLRPGEPPWDAPFVFDDFTFLHDLWHGGALAVVGIYVTFYGSLHLATRRLAAASPLMRLFRRFVLLKLLLHLASSLQLIPVAGIPAPLLTGSVTEAAAAGVVLGQVWVSAGARGASTATVAG